MKTYSDINEYSKYVQDKIFLFNRCLKEIHMLVEGKDEYLKYLYECMSFMYPFSIIGWARNYIFNICTDCIGHGKRVVAKQVYEVLSDVPSWTVRELLNYSGLKTKVINTLCEYVAKKKYEEFIDYLDEFECASDFHDIIYDYRVRYATIFERIIDMSTIIKDDKYSYEDYAIFADWSEHSAATIYKMEEDKDDDLDFRAFTMGSDFGKILTHKTLGGVEVYTAFLQFFACISIESYFVFEYDCIDEVFLQNKDNILGILLGMVADDIIKEAPEEAKENCVRFFQEINRDHVFCSEKDMNEFIENYIKKNYPIYYEQHKDLEEITENTQINLCNLLEEDEGVYESQKATPNAVDEYDLHTNYIKTNNEEESRENVALIDNKIVSNANVNFSFFHNPEIYREIPLVLDEKVKDGDNNLLMKFFENKYLKPFTIIANNIRDFSTQNAFIFMILSSKCFDIEKVLYASIPKIKEKISYNLNTETATEEWKEFWQQKYNVCDNVLDKIKKLNELYKVKKTDIEYNKKCWKIINVICLDIYEVLFSVDLKQTHKNKVSAYSIAERQMFKKFVLDENHGAEPNDITSQFIVDYQLEYDMEKQRNYWSENNRLPKQKKEKLLKLFNMKDKIAKSR